MVHLNAIWFTTYSISVKSVGKMVCNSRSYCVNSKDPFGLYNGLVYTDGGDYSTEALGHHRIHRAD